MLVAVLGSGCNANEYLIVNLNIQSEESKTVAERHALKVSTEAVQSLILSNYENLDGDGLIAVVDGVFKAHNVSKNIVATIDKNSYTILVLIGEKLTEMQEIKVHIPII